MDPKAILDEIKLNDSPYSSFSASRFFGKKVVDLEIGISHEFGFFTPSVRRVLFEDGTSLRIDGEHDIAYIEQPWRGDVDNWPQMKQSYLGPIYNAWNGFEECYEDGEENEDFVRWEDD